MGHLRQKLLTKTLLIPVLYIFSVTFAPSVVLSAEVVTIGNQAPSFLHPPSRYEMATNQGTIGHYAYEVYGSDQNGDDYYMLVCTTAQIAVSTFPAKCTEETICTSSVTASGTAAHCSPETTEEANAEGLINDWFVALCDTNPSNQSCSQPWNGTLPLENQKNMNIFNPPATTNQLASTSRSNPPSIEEITYNSLLLLLLCGTVIAVPMLILSVSDKKQAERLTVSVSLFIVVFTSFFALAATWPEMSVPQDTHVLGEQTLNSKVHTSQYSLPSIQNTSYPVYLEPDMASPIIYEAQEQERFTVRKKQEQWIQVFLPESGSGWIPKSNVK